LDKEDKSTTIFTETSTLINNIGITSSTQDNIKKTSSPKKLYILDGKEVPSKIIEEIKEQIGIINREAFAEVPPRVIYSLTPLGEELRPLLEEMYKWGLTYVKKQGRITED